MQAVTLSDKCIGHRCALVNRGQMTNHISDTQKLQMYIIMWFTCIYMYKHQISIKILVCFYIYMKVHRNNDNSSILHMVVFNVMLTLFPSPTFSHVTVALGCCTDAVMRSVDSSIISPLPLVNLTILAVVSWT